MRYLEIQNLYKRFVTPGGREIPALQGVSFSLERGDILCILGHNGSGKTTLLNCIRNTFSYDYGSVLVTGKKTDRNTKIVSVFQDVGLGVVGSMTPLENMSLVFSKKFPFMVSFPKKFFEKKIYDFLHKIEMYEQFKAFKDVPVSELSGGQRQQVAILMAVLRSPDILLLDEFVANLDHRIKSDILSWVKTWILSQKVTTLMVTHDRNLAESWGNWTLELSDGKVIRFEKTDECAR